MATSKQLKYKVMDINKIGIVFLFFMVINNVNSQILYNQIPIPLEQWGNNGPSGVGYYKDINGHFNKFIGIWEYNGSDKYLKIQFYKVEKISIWGDLLEANLFYDMLFSFIEYKEKQNGQWTTIYNTFDKEPVTIFNYYGSNRNSTIEGGLIIDSNFITLDCSEPLLEECKKLRGTLDLKYQEGSNPPQLIWERASTMYVSDSPPECIGIEREPFKIPANLVLTKINP